MFGQDRRRITRRPGVAHEKLEKMKFIILNN